METFSGCKAILSGPAGGVVGYAVTTYNTHAKQVLDNLSLSLSLCVCVCVCVFKCRLQ